ncbi:MAG: CdaR family protein [Myxococcota bacterium]
MLEWIFGNPHYKAAALFLAVMAWLYVQSDQLHEEPLKARVAWTLAPGLVSVDPLPTQVSIRVRGTRAAIRRARDLDVRIDVDIRDIGPGDHNLEFGPFPVSNIPSALEIMGHAPSGVRFALDEVSQRKVKVHAVVVGEPAPGYAVESIVVTPPVASLSGPGVTLADLMEVDTEPIDLSGFAGNTVVPLELDLPRTLENADGTRFTAEIEVVAQNAERTYAAVPVYVWGDAQYRSIERSVQVTVQGPAAQLKELDATDLAAFVHLPDTADAPRYEAAWGPKDGARLRVLHSAQDRLHVIAVEPSRVEVVAR